MVDIRNLTLMVHRNEEAIEQFRLLAGWRIFVTNVCEDSMTLNQSTQYYRDEWLVDPVHFAITGKNLLPFLQNRKKEFSIIK